MNKVAKFVLKVVGIGLAFAAAVCLVTASWDDMVKSWKRAVLNFRKKHAPEYDYFEEEENLSKED